MSDKTDKPAGDKPVVKKPYNAPVLVQWGNLREVTGTTGNSGNLDGGKGKSNRQTR